MNKTNVNKEKTQLLKAIQFYLYINRPYLNYFRILQHNAIRRMIAHHFIFSVKAEKRAIPQNAEM